MRKSFGLDKASRQAALDTTTRGVTSVAVLLNMVGNVVSSSSEMKMTRTTKKKNYDDVVKRLMEAIKLHYKVSEKHEIILKLICIKCVDNYVMNENPNRRTFQELLTQVQDDYMNSMLDDVYHEALTTYAQDVERKKGKLHGITSEALSSVTTFEEIFAEQERNYEQQQEEYRRSGRRRRSTTLQNSRRHGWTV